MHYAQKPERLEWARTKSGYCSRVCKVNLATLKVASIAVNSTGEVVNRKTSALCAVVDLSFFPLPRLVPPRTCPPAIQLRGWWWEWVCFRLFPPEAALSDSVAHALWQSSRPSDILDVVSLEEHVHQFGCRCLSVPFRPSCPCWYTCCLYFPNDLRRRRSRFSLPMGFLWHIRDVDLLTLPTAMMEMFHVDFFVWFVRRWEAAWGSWLLENLFSVVIWAFLSCSSGSRPRFQPHRHCIVPILLFWEHQLHWTLTSLLFCLFFCEKTQQCLRLLPACALRFPTACYDRVFQNLSAPSLMLMILVMNSAGTAS